MQKALIIVALVVWTAVFVSTLIFRGNTIANVSLLVVSIGLVVLGFMLKKKSSG